MEFCINKIGNIHLEKLTGDLVYQYGGTSYAAPTVGQLQTWLTSKLIDYCQEDTSIHFLLKYPVYAKEVYERHETDENFNDIRWISYNMVKDNPSYYELYEEFIEKHLDNMPKIRCGISYKKYVTKEVIIRILLGLHKRAATGEN